MPHRKKIEAIIRISLILRKRLRSKLKKKEAVIFIKQFAKNEGIM
ncbi:hypothetical protein AM305_08866 [Actinobacillus minor NM305]|uniref:Uncharacterized protein n=1 Tax=Actinobacillus minor NM305 TaxID=637911 RepID=C5S1J5_9PAST|nr:hypothetical protein AM305_08866 [Actinobacillus minor NM305]